MTFDVVQHSRKLNKLVEIGTPFAIVTLLQIRGSAPQIVGAKAIVTHAGIVSGMVGGGKIEAATIEHAQLQLAANDGVANELVTWNLQSDVGMTCGGEVKLFFEYHCRESWPVAVFGAGHVAQVLIPILLQLDCQVTCVDARSDWLEKLPVHPKLRPRCESEPRTTVSAMPPKTFFVLMSMGHATDMPVLAEILKTRNAPYIGVIGSKQKANVLRRELSACGIAASRQQQFVCPIGLPIGNNTPAEISISIIAQLIQKRDELGILKHKVKSF